MSNTPRAKQPVKRVARPAQKKTVCIAFIHPGQTSAYFTTSLAATLLYDQGVDRHLVAMVDEWSSANISNARNALTRKFLEEKTNADWLLWIDSDMQFDHDAMHRLVESADPVERPIMGGLCFGFNAETGLFPTIYQLIDKFGALTTVRVNDYPDDEIVRCSATGGAFLLVHRSVVQKMLDRKYNEAFPWFQETEMSGMPCGEDITFCLRAEMLGFPTHVNTSVKIGHHKSQLLTAELFRASRD